MKVIIWSPPFNWRNGGVIVLHKLCHLLRQQDVDAYIWVALSENHLTNPNYDTPIANNTDISNSIVIYPECLDGNPLGGKYVVRWLLYTRSPIQGQSDIVVSFSEKFREHYPNCDILRCFEFCFDKFYDNHQKRKGGCFVVRKGHYKKRIKETENQLELNYDQCQDFNFSSNILRTKEYFVSYDSATFLSIQAALCGCLSIVVPEEGISADEWRNSLPYFKYGIAYGVNDIQYARDTAPVLKNHLLSINEEEVSQVKKLIKQIKSLDPTL